MSAPEIGLLRAGALLICDYDERQAVAKVRWTVYGGVYKYAYVCAYHLSCCKGEPGVDVLEEAAK